MTASKIRILSDHTINQIAAGEVIENPASVIKELVENALDAGGQHIVIETQGGGLLIRVSDDGDGMSQDDAVLSLERHATSKIRNAEDLFHLETMGFRGEALASIGAISKVSLITSQADGVGARVEMEGGRLLRVEPCARQRGTTVEVRALFYNVPARKKFQKSAGANAADITRLVTGLSLAHPAVNFELIQQQRTALCVKVREEDSSFEELLKHRIQEVLGEPFLNACLPLNMQDGPYLLRGFIGMPLEARKTRSGQYLFINSRAVFCPQISYAIKDGYGTRMADNRHPIYVLHIQIPADAVDVNVHPQKKEVRLKDPDFLRKKIMDAISSTLDGKQSLSFVLPHQDPPFSLCREGCSFEELSPFQAVANSMPMEEISWPLKFKEDRGEIYPEKAESLALKKEIASLGLYMHYLILDAVTLQDYIEMDFKGGLLLVDLLAAHATVLFESLVKGDNSWQKQGLLLPITCHLNLDDMSIVEKHHKMIEAMGFSFQAIGKQTLLIDAIPPFLQEADLADFFSEIADQLNNAARKEDLEEQKKQKMALTACRFAKARKKEFVLKEAEILFEKLLEAKSPYLCPQGKPTMVHLSHEEITRIFLRRSPLA